MPRSRAASMEMRSKRLEKLCATARERLKPLAAPDVKIHKFYWANAKIQKIQRQLGNDDGAGIHLLAAKLDRDGDCVISEQELAIFNEQGKEYATSSKRR